MTGPNSANPAGTIEPIDAYRTRLRTQLGAQAVPGSLRPPELAASHPLGALPAPTMSKINRRIAGGMEPTGTHYPRDGVWQRGVVGSIAMSGLDAVLWVIAELIGHHGLADVAGILFFAFLVIAGASAAYALTDPLRLTTTDRRALTVAGHWESRQQWIGPVSATPERALIGVAAQVTERIAASNAWSSSFLDDHQIRLNLIAELDQIDEQAHHIAVLRLEARGHQTTSPAVAGELTRQLGAADQIWDGALERVANLTRYADQLSALDGQLADLYRLQRTDAQVGQLLAGSARDEFATDTVRELTSGLDYLRAEIAATVTQFGAAGALGDGRIGP